MIIFINAVGSVSGHLKAAFLRILVWGTCRRLVGVG